MFGGRDPEQVWWLLRAAVLHFLNFAEGPHPAFAMSPPLAWGGLAYSCSVYIDLSNDSPFTEERPAAQRDVIHLPGTAPSWSQSLPPAIVKFLAPSPGTPSPVPRPHSRWRQCFRGHDWDPDDGVRCAGGSTCRKDSRLAHRARGAHLVRAGLWTTCVTPWGCCPRRQTKPARSLYPPLAAQPRGRPPVWECVCSSQGFGTWHEVQATHGMQPNEGLDLNSFLTIISRGRRAPLWVG